MSIQRVFLILLAAVLLPAGAFAQSTTRATFTVNKTFTDGNNTLPIRYDISCNTGVPITQFQLAPAGTFAVEFVVEAFDQGELDCRVWETEAAGYSADYAASSAFAVASSVDGGAGQGCFFADVDSTTYVSGPMNVCAIANSPTPVTITVTKDWVIDNLDTGDALDPTYSLTLWCAGTISGDPATSRIVGGGISGNNSFRQLYDNDTNGTSDTNYPAQVIPLFGVGTSCWVNEIVADSAVDVDDIDCDSLHVGINQGDSCTITNTVFFEGIPTLSQYGMAIMALLMLGVGFVGFRRFV